MFSFSLVNWIAMHLCRMHSECANESRFSLVCDEIFFSAKAQPTFDFATEETNARD